MPLVTASVRRVNGLIEADLPVVCVETRHMKALLKAQQVNKSDRNDARGIAQMMRVGLFKPVHVKTLIAQEQRMLRIPSLRRSSRSFLRACGRRALSRRRHGDTGSRARFCSAGGVRFRWSGPMRDRRRGSCRR